MLLLFSNYQVPNTTRTAVVRPGDPANACVGLVAGRDRAVRVVQPPLPMLDLDQRRHDWQRNTFRCTCCCCSQITKYPTQLVPPWRAQGSGLTRVGGFPGRDRAVRVVQPPLPMLDQRRHDWQRNTFRCTCCCCSQITKYPTQLVPPWRAQGSGLTRNSSGRDRAVRVVQPPLPMLDQRRLATKHLSLHVLLLFSNYQVPNTTRTAVARPGIRANARWGIPLGATWRYELCSHPCPC